MANIKRYGSSSRSRDSSQVSRSTRMPRLTLSSTLFLDLDSFLAPGQMNDVQIMSSSGDESECCTDPDPDSDDDYPPDVDTDGPDMDEPGDEEPPVGEPPGGEPSPGEDPKPPSEDEEEMFEIWDCWANGNCSDTGGDDDDIGNTGETGGGGWPGSETDSGAG